MTKAAYSQMEKYMLSCLSQSSHDKEHAYRVLFAALKIASSEKNVDSDVLIAACLLHDIARPEQLKNPQVCHAKYGAQKAAAFLLSCGFEDGFTARVADCIRTHRFRSDDIPQSIEAKILFDADKLDVTGAVGIARTLMYNGETDTPLYTLTESGKTDEAANAPGASFVREYNYKLTKLYDKFFTEGGKRLAEERRHSAESFYNALVTEVSETRSCGKALLGELLK